MSTKAESPREEFERKHLMAAAMLDYLESWVVGDLCFCFRTLADAVYTETFEHKLLRALVEDSRPQSLQVIASRCGASRYLMLPGGRLRRVVERMEKAGIISKSGSEERPRYSLNHHHGLIYNLLQKTFEKPMLRNALTPSSLHQSFRPELHE